MSDKKITFQKFFAWAFFIFLISIPISLGISDVGLGLCAGMGVYAFLSLGLKPTRPKATPFRSFVLFLISASFSVIFSVDRIHSLIGLKELRPFFMLLAVPLLSREENLFRFLKTSALILAIITCGASFFSFAFHPQVRFFEKFVSEGHLTLMCIQTILFSTAVLSVQEGEGKNWLSRGFMTAFFLLAFLDANVPLFVALSAESLIVFFILGEHKKKHFFWALPLVFLFLFAFTGRHSDNYLLHLLPGYEVMLIDEARTLALKDPIFGTGYDTFSVMNSLQEKRAFSDVLTAYVNMGVLGMTALIVFLFDLTLFAFRLRSKTPFLGHSAFIFLALFLFLSAFNPMFFTPHGMRYLVSVWVLMEAVERR